MALKQEGSVAKYRVQFEVVSATLKEASDDLLVGAFTNGLKEEIKAEVRMLGTQSLLGLVQLAQKVENCNAALKRQKEAKKMALEPSVGPKWSGLPKPTFSRANTLLEQARTANLTQSGKQDPKLSGDGKLQMASSVGSMTTKGEGSSGSGSSSSAPITNARISS